MRARIAFFNTSAIVPLCVAQQCSAGASALPWLHATCCRLDNLNRGNRSPLSGRNSRRVERIEFESGAESACAAGASLAAKILPSDRVRSLTLELLRLHYLRAGDAIQLASALVWCNQKPAHVRLSHSMNNLHGWLMQLGSKSSSSLTVVLLTLDS